MKPFIAAVVAVALALVLVVGGAFGIAAFGGTCADDLIDPQQASRLEPIAGYSGDQLAYAAVILNTVTESGVDARAGVIAVTAAMTRSQLRNLVTPPALGLFGLADEFGTDSERLSPAFATQRFVAALTASPEWIAAAPADAIIAAIPDTDANAVEMNLEDAATVTQALRATQGACSVSNDPVALAQELVEAADQGQLRGMVPDHIKQIRWIAQGQAIPNCGIDTRVLQIIVIAVRNFDRVVISDINRRCTGELLGAGQYSTHWLDGGGYAVDFAALEGQAITGADAASFKLVSLLDPIVPTGARIGQSDCRAEAGTSIATQNFTQFEDGCNHLHVDVYYADNRGLSL